MTAAKNRKINDTDPLVRARRVQEATSVLLQEAIKHCVQSKLEDCARKWLVHLVMDPDEPGAATLFASAMILALELGVYAPSFSGARPIDRMARTCKPAGADEAAALDALKKARFRLFAVVSVTQDHVAKVKDLATGEAFLLFDDAFTRSDAGWDFAARLAPLDDDMHIVTGPKITLDPATLAVAQEFTRPGRGLVNDQRCAAAVYRHILRHGGAGGPDFGDAREPDASKILSYSDEALDALALAWSLRNDATDLGPGDVEAARALTSGRRLAAALASSIELKEWGKTRLAEAYRLLARIQMETFQRRAQVGSGDANPLETIRATLQELVANRAYPADALALFVEMSRRLTLVSGGANSRGEDLGRIIDRIRGLRAKTLDQGCTEQEALAAARKVAEMLERYGLSLSEVELQQQPCEGFGIDTGRRKHGPLDRCPPAIARFCDCRTWSEITPLGTIRFVFFGLSADVEAAHYLYDLVGSAFDTETARFRQGKIFAAMVGAEKRSAVTSFQIGLATGINGKLDALKTERNASVFKSTGRDLVPIKTSVTDAEFEKLGLSLTSRNTSRRRHVMADAFAAGQVAGRKFEVNASIG